MMRNGIQTKKNNRKHAEQIRRARSDSSSLARPAMRQRPPVSLEKPPDRTTTPTTTSTASHSLSDPWPYIHARARAVERALLLSLSSGRRVAAAKHRSVPVRVRPAPAARPPRRQPDRVHLHLHDGPVPAVPVRAPRELGQRLQDWTSRRRSRRLRRRRGPGYITGPGAKSNSS